MPIAALLFAAVPAGLPPGAIDALGTPAFRHTCPVTAVAFSPDGRRLASASNVNAGGVDPTLTVWDVSTGTAVMRIACDGTAVAWFADGSRVAAAARDGSVKVWEVPTGREAFAGRVGGGWAIGVAVSPDGRTLASAHGNRRAVRLWDVATGRTVRELVPPAGATGDLAGVGFHPDGRWVAAGVPGVGLTLWDVATGAEVRTVGGVFSPSNLEPREIRFAGPDALVAVCQTDGVGLFDPATGREAWATRGTRPGDPTRSGVTGVARSADGSRLALVRNHELTLWDVAAGRQGRAFETAVRSFGPFALSPTGDRLARADGFGVAVWDTATGRRLHDAGAITGYVGVVGFGPAGEALVGDATGLRAWDVGAGGRRRGEPVPAAADVVGLSPDGRTAVHGGWNWAARPRLTDVSTGKDRVALGVADREGVLSAAFVPGGAHLVTVDLDQRSLSLWDVATGRRVRRLVGHNDPVDAVAVSPDGRRMATAGAPRAYIREPFPGHVPDTGIRVWNLDTGAEVRQIPGRAGCLAFSPNGKLLAAGLEDWKAGVRLVDADTGALVRTIPAERYGPTRLAFTPDGRTLAAVGRDKAVRLWDVATGAERRRFDGHAGEVYSLAISADGRRLLTAGGDGRAFVWAVPDR
jgi:WD40 repeat protein